MLHVQDLADVSGNDSAGCVSSAAGGASASVQSVSLGCINLLCADALARLLHQVRQLVRRFIWHVSDELITFHNSRRATAGTGEAAGAINAAGQGQADSGATSMQGAHARLYAAQGFAWPPAG